MMNEQIILLIAFVLVLGYLYLKHRLAIVMQSFRLRLAEDGERLLGDPRVTEPEKARVRTQLDVAYSGAVTWVFAVMAIPAAFMVAWKKLRNVEPSLADAGDPSVQRELNSVGNRATLSLMAASPLAASILFAEALLLVLLRLPISAVRNALVDKAKEHDHTSNRFAH